MGGMPDCARVCTRGRLGSERWNSTQRLSDTARELVDANQALAAIPARTRDEISGLFGDWTLADPGLTDIWAWRPEDETVTNTSGFMTILGGVARKD